MALFGGRSEERKKRAESLIDMSKDPSLAEELGELAASGSRREIDRAGSEVQQAVTEAYGLNRVPEPNDVADALAIALCCLHAMPSERKEATRA